MPVLFTRPKSSDDRVLAHTTAIFHHLAYKQTAYITFLQAFLILSNIFSFGWFALSHNCVFEKYFLCPSKCYSVGIFSKPNTFSNLIGIAVRITSSISFYRLSFNSSISYSELFYTVSEGGGLFNAIAYSSKLDYSNNGHRISFNFFKYFSCFNNKSVMSLFHLRNFTVALVIKVPKSPLILILANSEHCIHNQLAA